MTRTTSPARPDSPGPPVTRPAGAAGPALRRADGSPVRVLVVDDEPTLTDLLAMALRYEGWEVRTAAAGRDGVRAAREFLPDAVVLDVMLPDLDGLDVLHRMRAEDPRVPVLFLTAKDAVEDRIAGLTAGGDDYVTKPFSLEEVVARLRGLMRRTVATVSREDALLVVGDLTLDEDSREVRRAGELVTLTATEFELLRYPHAQPAAGAEQGADPGPGVELRLRRAGERCRALHLLPAQEDRRRADADDPHHAWRGVRPQAGGLSRAVSPVMSTVMSTVKRLLTPSRWTLRTRLVAALTAVSLLVCAVVATVTLLALHNSLTNQLDEQLGAAARRTASAERPPDGARHRLSDLPGPLTFLGAPGTGVGTLGARLTGGTVTDAGTLDSSGDLLELSSAARAALTRLPADEQPHTLDLAGVGSYRLVAARAPDGDVLVTGLSLEPVNRTVVQVAGVVAGVAALGLLAAFLAGATIVRRSLRPLNRVAATATRVAQLPLHRGRGRVVRARTRQGTPIHGPRSAGSAPRSTRCSATSLLRWPPGIRVRREYGSSSPTPATSCGHRWRRSAGMPR